MALVIGRVHQVAQRHGAFGREVRQIDPQQLLRDQAQGIGLAVLLFAISWGLRDLFLTAVGPEEASPALAFISGMLIGGVVAICSRMLRLWPGGFWSATAAHFLAIYLIIGFID